MSDRADLDLSKTTMRRYEQYRDRWSSYGSTTGIVALSDRLSAAELRAFEIFEGYDDAFLERISPDVSVVSWRENAMLFEQGSYLDLAFFVVEGSVQIFLDLGVAGPPEPIFDPTRTAAISRVAAAASSDRTTAIPTLTTAAVPRGPGPGTSVSESHEITLLATMDFDLPRGQKVHLGPGEIFGEIGALSGWPQSVTARTETPCRLVQIRLPALRLMKRRSAELKKRIDEIYRERALLTQLRSTPLLRGCGERQLESLRRTVKLVSCDPDEVIVRQGEDAGALFLVRSGFIKLSQEYGAGDLIVSYLSKGMILGEIELLVEGLEGWQSTATSVEYAELVEIPGAVVRQLLEESPQLEEPLWRSVITRIKEVNESRRDIGHAAFTQEALERGLVQGNSMLVIDLDQCTRCDDCVRACAETHEGRPRFVREGDRVDNLLIAKSCYHCRDPVCLIGCPTGAIHRAGVAEVVAIDDEVCIGCATCANNCPYDAIVMHDTGSSWPDDMVPAGLRGLPRQVASKCDLCRDTGHDPACVSNCPQACAFRVGSIDEIQSLLDREDES